MAFAALLRLASSVSRPCKAAAKHFCQTGGQSQWDFLNG
jgi:hypothetical protein